MKTKEIDVWVDDAYIKDFESYANTIVWSKEPSVKSFKAKLIIEIPEKKKEITESELARALAIVYAHESKSPFSKQLSTLKEELGFKDK